jgi:hypothetical protein
MTSAELAEEVFDDPELLRARDPRNLLPAVAGAGAQVRETTRLTQEAGLERVTAGGRPRGLVFVARREGAVAASVLRALLGPTSLVTVDVVPDPGGREGDVGCAGGGAGRVQRSVVGADADHGHPSAGGLVGRGHRVAAGSGAGGDDGDVGRAHPHR